MKQKNIKRIASILVDYSVYVKKSDNVLVSFGTSAKDLGLAVYELCMKKGAITELDISEQAAEKIYYDYAGKGHIAHFPKHKLMQYRSTDKFIIIRAVDEPKLLQNVKHSKISERSKILKQLSDERLKKPWILFYYPTKGLAKEAGMSYENYEKFVVGSCTLDWKKLGKKMSKIAAVLKKTKNVRITGLKTDLSFSIKGLKPVVCAGEFNMPDGEVFTGIIKESVNGYIYFDEPQYYMGNCVDKILLKFKNGRVVDAKAGKNSGFLKSILNTDAGSRYLGEFGIGCNPRIDRFTKQILFDEKIGGTIHLALGNSYKESNGGNKSAIHWDLIKSLKNNGRITVNNRKVLQDNGMFMI